MVNVRSGLEGNNWLRDKIKSGEPFCAGKIGGTECSILSTFIRNQEVPQQLSDLSILAGMYPRDQKSFKLFSALMLQSLEHVDALSPWNLGTGRGEELVVPKYMKKDCEYFELKCLDPLHFCSNDDEPWSRALEGKKVVIINSFLDTIKHQLNNRGWDTMNFLPKFKTTHVIRTKYSIEMDEFGGHNDWTEEYRRITESLNAADFDIALVGCGAIGLPLCSYIRSRLNKQAVHTAGSTQLMFGINGDRWKTRDYVQQHVNEHWTYPFPSDTPNRTDIIKKLHFGEPTYFEDK